MKTIRYFLGALWMMLASASAGDNINSLAIAQATLKGMSHCLHYRITGMCFWLHCRIAGCVIKPTLKVSHYLPDVVVSVYAHHDDNPWWFARTLLDPVAYQAGRAMLQKTSHFRMRSGDAHQRSQRDSDNRFHEVDVIGHPLLWFWRSMPFLLPSAASAYQPYYTSLLDAYAWRFPTLERFYPGSIVPGLHEVGTLLLHDWGPVYPRNGMLNQPDDAKAAAVVAQRAMDIITKAGQPHLYHQLSNHCGDHCQAAAVKENDVNTAYQLIYPKQETQCVVFGENDISHSHPWQTDAAALGDHRYVWVLWRRYHGCLPSKGDQYLSSVDF